MSVEVFGIWRLSSGLHTVPLGKVHVCHLETDRWKAGLNGTTGCSDSCTLTTQEANCSVAFPGFVVEGADSAVLSQFLLIEGFAQAPSATSWIRH